MSPSKARLTVTVDPELVEVASAAVKEGRASSVSSWVNRAMAEKAAQETTLAAAAAAVAAYEAECGVITDEELEAQERADREAARTWRERHRQQAG